MQIRILKLNYSKATNIYTMGLRVLYYVEYTLYNVKKSGIFSSGLELHFKMKSKGRIGWKTSCEKEKFFVTSNFSFSHNVFHSYIS